MNDDVTIDVALIGAGVMSATLGAWLFGRFPFGKDEHHARVQAMAAATGSTAALNWLIHSKVCGRRRPSNPHRITRGCRTFQSLRAETRTPTRRRGTTSPKDSSTRMASRETDRETSNSVPMRSSRRTSPGCR